MVQKTYEILNMTQYGSINTVVTFTIATITFVMTINMAFVLCRQNISEY